MHEVIWNEQAGGTLKKARINLESQGALQTTVADAMGVSQGFLSQMENGTRSPRLRTLANWLRVVSPGMYPEEERFLWNCILGGTHDIDFAAKLNLPSFESAKAKAKSQMDAGLSRDAWYILRALEQLAKTPLEKAYAALLMGNRAKDLGIFEVGNRFASPAEAHFHNALSFLNGDNSVEAREIRAKVTVNLAELHLELHRADIAEALTDSLLKRPKDLLPEVRAHAYFVRGRVQAERGELVKAARNLRAGRKAYAELGNHNLADWISMYLANAKKDEKVLKELIEKYGPGQNPSRPNELLDPETFAWSTYFLADLTDDKDLARKAKEAAEKFGFRNLVYKAMLFLGEHPTIVLVFVVALAAMGMMLLDGGTSTALAKSCN